MLTRRTHILYAQNTAPPPQLQPHKVLYKLQEARETAFGGHSVLQIIHPREYSLLTTKEHRGLVIESSDAESSYVTSDLIQSLRCAHISQMLLRRTCYAHNTAHCDLTKHSTKR